jgi:hypothetical protein
METLRKMPLSRLLLLELSLDGAETIESGRDEAAARMNGCRSYWLVTDTGRDVRRCNICDPTGKTDNDGRRDEQVVGFVLCLRGKDVGRYACYTRSQNGAKVVHCSLYITKRCACPSPTGC